MNQFIKTYLSAALIPLLLTACGEKKPATTVTEDAVIIRTQPVTVTNYAPTLEYSGMMASTNEAKLSFKIAGVISRIYVKEGDHVSKGQLLATLDLTEINAQVQQSLQNAQKVQRDAERVKSLLDDTAATLEQYQNVQTQLNVANENVRIAKFNQEYAQIHATDNGTIIKKIMNEGELAASGSPVFLLNGASSNDWVVRFGVSDKDWALLKKGEAATVQLDAYPATDFKGIITKVSEAADAASGTYEIEVKVLPDGKKFASGLFANIKISSSATQQVSMIPVEALAEGDGKTGYVYLLNADKKTVKKQAVQIAFIDKDKIAIRSGLENVSEVITDGVSYLTENSKVKVDAPNP
ncbi:MAG TPA: efflux RND transporter periplasmic adaptor subunit [Panacibacter sp.]|nr:efflux RND transporter periplasmic adaptor subunit [Panacibacter sp.]